MENIELPLVKLPEEIDATLFLIREQLKICQLFALFEEIGMSDCAYRPNLDKLIIKSLDFPNTRDEDFEVYLAIIDKRAKKLNGDYERLTRQSVKTYLELIEAKKKINQNLSNP